MCDIESGPKLSSLAETIPVTQAIGMVLAHDITEIRPDEFKGRAFKKGHVVREEDIGHLKRLGKEHLYVLKMGEGDLHEDDAASIMANALMGQGLATGGSPKEGKINIIAAEDGLLKVNIEGLTQFNMLGEVMCASLHNNTLVRKGQVVAGTRAIPLIISKEIVREAAGIAQAAGGLLEVKALRKPRVGIVITGNEVYYGRIKDAFAPVIREKLGGFGGEVTGVYYAPDDKDFIRERLGELKEAGADLLITTGGMSVDPDDVTRHAIRELGATDFIYGSAVLPGAMFLVAYLQDSTPVLGIPACGMYHKTTIFDLVLPRVLAGEKLGRRDLAEMGHGGLCLNCEVCRYPVCPFGK